MAENSFAGITGIGLGAPISPVGGGPFDPRGDLMEELKKFAVVAGKKHLSGYIDPEKQCLAVCLQFLPQYRRAGHMRRATLR